MHEVSLVHALFDQVDRAIVPHVPTSVRQLTVRIGELAGIECEQFRTAFDGCREDRGYGAATLAIVAEPAAWVCEVCGENVPRGGSLRCLSCSACARLVAGGALMLDRVELEVPNV